MTHNLCLSLLAPPRRGGLPRGTGPRCLPEAARLRGVPNPGEGLPPRVPGELRGGGRRTGHLLHPPPQQTQEIHLPVHRRLVFCPGSGEGCQVWLYKLFLVKKKKKRDSLPSRLIFLPTLLDVQGFLSETNPSPSTGPLPRPSLLFFYFFKPLKRK